ncbi:MAG TPA: MbnP family protein [Bacteroidia bacterium]|nr:MbnP family protein [Bacteroidia bacterium]
MKTLRIYLLAFFALISVFFSSCHKKAKNDAPTELPTGTVMCHLHSFIEDEEIDLYNIPYTTHDGRSISVKIAQLYISDIELVKLDGSVYSVPNSKILKKLDIDTYFIGEAPVGNYKSVRFKVGLPPASNQVDFSNTSDSIMWFTKTKADDGYVFLNLQGAIDTSAALTGTLTPFVYKIGSNVNYKQVEMPAKGYTVVAGEVMYIHLIADFNKLFNGIKINDNANLFVRTVADNATPLAQKIVNNIPSLFIYE